MIGIEKGVIERELAEVRGFERERVNIRNRSLIDNNLAGMQHVVLIPPNVETNENNENNNNLIQDNTVSSTTDDNQLQPVNLRLFSFFQKFFLRLYLCCFFCFSFNGLCMYVSDCFFFLKYCDIGEGF